MPSNIPTTLTILDAILKNAYHFKTKPLCFLPIDLWHLLQKIAHAQKNWNIMHICVTYNKKIKCIKTDQ